MKQKPHPEVWYIEMLKSLDLICILESLLFGRRRYCCIAVPKLCYEKQQSV